jgi:hypothetical protein
MRLASTLFFDNDQASIAYHFGADWRIADVFNEYRNSAGWANFLSLTGIGPEKT